MGERVVEVKLPNGGTVLARLAEHEAGATKTSAFDDLDFADLGQTLEGVVDVLKSALDKATPEKVSVSLGLELAVRGGKLTGLIVDGQAKGSISVTLEWGAGLGG